MAGRIKGQGSKWIEKSTRHAIYHRDGFCCVYCGASPEDGAILTLDHLLACDLGGDNSAKNLVTACLVCNSAKRNLSTTAWFKVLASRGVDTKAMGRRIYRLKNKELNRAEGRRLAALAAEARRNDAIAA